jgi:isocitrate dehydrogenase
MNFESQSLLKAATDANLATPITVAYGDGIGPEIMQATLRILAAAGAKIAPEAVDIGEKVYLGGNSAGIEDSAWESLRRTKVFLKAPITTPSGGGYKSLNVTVRKTMGLYANVRPCVSYAPYVDTLHPKMDIVIVRENEEDLYAGIEHRQTDEVFQCLKLITRPGCEKIVRYAFEYAKNNGRKKVTCMVKDNIMKMTDGLFYKVFQEIGAEYPDIEQERYIIDIGAARLATRPEIFDVIVTPNLYGDIISDIAAEMTGSVGLAGSANIGEHVAMFEAIHGSAPDIAGQDIANPSGLLLGAVMMLVHIGQHEVASKIHNAWLATLEAGVATQDLLKDASLEIQDSSLCCENSSHRRESQAALRRCTTCEKGLGRRGYFSARPPRQPGQAGRDAPSAAGESPCVKKRQLADDHQSGRKSLATRLCRNFLHRPLALPFRRSRQRRHDHAARYRESARCFDRRRPRRDQNRKSLHL